MTDNTPGLIEAIRSGWPQLVGLFSIAWWARKIDLRSKDSHDRLDRHEGRMQGLEQSHQDQAVRLARIEEALSGIKLTLDRIYSEMRDRKP